MNKNNNAQLLKCTIQHQIKGRMRISCKALKYLYGHEDEIGNDLVKLTGVNSIKVTSLTGNVLVYFDPEKTNERVLMKKLEDIISLYSIVAYKRQRKERSQLTVNERRLQEEPVSELFKNIVLGVGSLLWTMVRKKGAGKLLGISSLSAIFLSRQIFISGIKSLIRTRRPNADSLSAAAISASLLSGNTGSALTIILLADTAELLTAYSMNRTRNAIRNMLSTGEKFVWKMAEDGSIIKISQDSIEVGDQIVVHSGEIISVDGHVVNGNSFVDESSISGEFMPKEKTINDKVYAGSSVTTGTITVYAEQIKENTAASKIIQMVEEASQHKANIQTMADRFSAHLIPLNFVLGTLVYIITGSVSRALNMLVIDYSCGIRLSTATALTAAISTGARNRILIKGSNYLETLAETDTVIFDKTGTLTEGTIEVKSIIPVHDQIDENQLISLTAAAEETSTHPIAHAIIEKAELLNLEIPRHCKIEVVVARGVYTTVNKEVIRVGNAKFMRENNISLENVKETLAKMMIRGEIIIYVAKENILIGLIGMFDPLRENMKKTINRLRNLEIDDIILLTGDVEQQAELVSSKMTVDRYKSELMPEDKARFALNLQSKGSRVVMIGDGINDAPVLAYADVGIALGSKRTDIAMEAADIVIQSDNPLDIPSSIRLARNTTSIIKQNFAASIGINSVGLVLGAMGILPVFWGAFIHNMTTIAVVSNSLRLLFFKMDK